MIRRPPRSTLDRSSAASDVYKRQVPLSRSVFWGPMAVAIMGGLVVATVLTLLALPAMYAAWFRVAPAGDDPTPAHR